MSELALTPSRRAIIWCDVAVATTTALFAALGVLAGAQVAALADLHRTLLEAAHALDLTARAVALVDGVPFIGDDAGRLADSVRETATSVRASATTVQDELRAVGLLVGVVIAAIPIIPLVLLYLPLRLARRRELRRLRRMLHEPAEPALVEHLARAAVRRVPYQELHRVTANPWLDIEHGRHTHLAAAELRRLGLRSPSWITPGHAGPGV
jgi:hypothetical protein